MRRSTWPRTGPFLRFVFAFFTFESKQPSRSVRSRFFPVSETTISSPAAAGMARCFEVRAFLTQLLRASACAQTSNRGSSFSAHVLDIFCAARQGVENLVRRRRTDNQR